MKLPFNIQPKRTPLQERALKKVALIQVTIGKSIFLTKKGILEQTS